MNLLPKIESGHLEWDKLKRKGAHLEWDGGSISYVKKSCHINISSHFSHCFGKTKITTKQHETFFQYIL